MEDKFLNAESKLNFIENSDIIDGRNTIVRLSIFPIYQLLSGVDCWLNLEIGFRYF